MICIDTMWLLTTLILWWSEEQAGIVCVCSIFFFLDCFVSEKRFCNFLSFCFVKCNHHRTEHFRLFISWRCAWNAKALKFRSVWMRKLPGLKSCGSLRHCCLLLSVDPGDSLPGKLHILQWPAHRLKAISRSDGLFYSSEIENGGSFMRSDLIRPAEPLGHLWSNSIEITYSHE